MDMEEAISLHKSEDLTRKQRGYFLVCDEQGNEYRLPAHLFAAVDQSGNEVDPDNFNAASLAHQEPVFRFKRFDEQEQLQADIHYVSVSKSGVERITLANQMTMVGSGWEIDGHAYDYPEANVPGWMIQDYRRDTSEPEEE